MIRGESKLGSCGESKMIACLQQAGNYLATAVVKIINFHSSHSIDL
jgi:hypothetical protein